MMMMMMMTRSVAQIESSHSSAEHLSFRHSIALSNLCKS